MKENHIRQGQAGAWTKVLTVDDSKLMDEHHDAKCFELGLPMDLFDM